MIKFKYEKVYLVNMVITLEIIKQKERSCLK